MNVTLFTLFIASFSLASYAAKPIQLQPDSKIGFSIIKFKIGAPVEGQFKDFSGTAKYDPKKDLLTDIQAKVKVNSIDTGKEKRDSHLKTKDFFNAEKYPTITFKAKNQQKLQKKFTMQGDLTIKGVTKNVSLKMKTEKKKDGKVILEGTGEINRLDYNITWNKALEKSKWTKVLGVLGKTVLDNKVTLKLKLVATAKENNKSKK